jgi:hypothetical protein
MPGGGLIALNKYGSENLLFNGNPSMTYFNKVFRQYTPFSQESTSFSFEGPTELFYDRPITIRCKIQRVADLLTDAYFVFELPEIYSKYVDRAARPYQYNFAWVNYIGATIINKASFLIGGQRIQEFDNAYIVAKAHADMDVSKLEKWKRLVGETPELTNPGLGLYGGGSEVVGYPNVYEVSGANVQNNRPSIQRTTIRIPLPFWFTEHPSLALPLIALQYTECEIQIELRPIQDLYTIIDPSGNRVRPGTRMTSLNVNNPEFALDTSAPEFREFLVDIGFTTPPLNLLAIRPQLELTYVYVSKTEQKVFAEATHSYLLPQVTRYHYDGISSRQQLDLETHNLGKRIFVIPRRSDSIESRNAWYNFTNWANYPYIPYTPTPGLDAYANLIYSSGLITPQGQRDIVRGMRFLVDGNELQEEKDTAYYTDLMPYKYNKGPGYTGLLVHSFELEADPLQPSGTINFSLIRNFQAEVDVWPVPNFTNYLYDITFYVETYNFLKISAGIGGLAFAL